jgi:hypothetical protein
MEDYIKFYVMESKRMIQVVIELVLSRLHSHIFHWFELMKKYREYLCVFVSTSVCKCVYMQVYTACTYIMNAMYVCGAYVYVHICLHLYHYM